MAENAIKTKMVWWNLYTFNNKKCRPKKTFLHKESHGVALIGVLISSKQHKELGRACQSCVLEFSYSPTGKITIQIQPDFAENHGKQIQKGFLLSNEKMSCRHTKSPFLYFTKAKTCFVEKVSQACDFFYSIFNFTTQSVN